MLSVLGLAVALLAIVSIYSGRGRGRLFVLACIALVAEMAIVAVICQYGPDSGMRFSRLISLLTLICGFLAGTVFERDIQERP